MAEDQVQSRDVVQLPRSVVMNAIPMLFWVSQAMQWTDPSHQKALDDLYREAAAAVGMTYIRAADGVNPSQSD